MSGRSCRVDNESLSFWDYVYAGVKPVWGRLIGLSLKILQTGTIKQAVACFPTSSRSKKMSEQ
jgi:hypothetical protein